MMIYICIYACTDTHTHIYIYMQVYTNINIQTLLRIEYAARWHAKGGTMQCQNMANKQTILAKKGMWQAREKI